MPCEITPAFTSSGEQVPVVAHGEAGGGDVVAQLFRHGHEPNRPDEVVVETAKRVGDLARRRAPCRDNHAQLLLLDEGRSRETQEGQAKNLEF